MGKKAWSDPQKAMPVLNRIPMGRFAGEPLLIELYICNAIVYQKKMML